jgi:hypothetical protein
MVQLAVEHDTPVLVVARVLLDSLQPLQPCSLVQAKSDDGVGSKCSLFFYLTLGSRDIFGIRTPKAGQGWRLCKIAAPDRI